MLLLLPFLLFSAIASHAAAVREVTSPDQSVRVTVTLDSVLTYRVFHKNRLVIAPSRVDMTLTDGRKLSQGLAKPRFKTTSHHGTIVSPVPEKRRNIPDHYNELRVELPNGFAVLFRAYDDGAAYRIVTSFREHIQVAQETASFCFPDNPLTYMPEVTPSSGMDIYHTAFEELYGIRPLDSIATKSLFFTPVLVAGNGTPKIVITESDLEEYPGMFLRRNAGGLVGDFASYPAKIAETNDLYAQKYVSKRERFIAQTKGSRDFPWRVIVIAAQDKDLPANDLVYRLAAPSRLADVSWIKPGKATEEWIISSNIFNVDFKSGINTATYKYYIDFAKKFGFERILMDAGWSDTHDLFKITPGIDMEEISAYAKEKNIKLSMWTLALTLEKQLEPALDQFNKWGVDFIMTDFINRDDQVAVAFFYRIAEACARHKLMLMFHGAFKPAGFNRTFPHAVTREAVLGSEYNMWSDKVTPRHNLLLPFIRMVSGPMDYEPGQLTNAHRQSFRYGTENVTSMTTRTQQLAMFVVYESPIQFFSGNPAQGLMEPDFMHLLGGIPTTWDTTRILDAKLGEYLITARKKGKDWYIGAMTGNDAHDFTIPLDFLAEGSYQATICADGINAERYAADYRISSETVSSKTILPARLAAGGGYVVRLVRKE
jgi:alpha-glucosidase